MVQVRKFCQKWWPYTWRAMLFAVVSSVALSKLSDEWRLTIAPGYAKANVIDIDEDAADDDRGKSHPFTNLIYRFRGKDGRSYTGTTERPGWNEKAYRQEVLSIRYDRHQPEINGEVPARSPWFMLTVVGSIVVVILVWLGMWLYRINTSGFDLVAEAELAKES